MNTPKSVAVDFDPFAAGELARSAPLTGPQREIWAAVQLGGDAASCAYNEMVSLTLEGALDEEALARALDALATRHDSLRSTFALDGRTLLIAASGALPLTHDDVRSERDPVAAYRALERGEATKPLDLEKGPLARARLVRIGENTHQLLLCAHHIVCDGWSLGVLLRELGPLYEAAQSGKDAGLAPAESFGDYADEQARVAQGADARKALGYWLEQYRDAAPVLELPTDRTRPALRTYRAERLDYPLDAALVARLREYAKQQHASLLQVLLTGFHTLMARLTGQWDVVVGLSAAGQANDGRLGLVGHAVNYLPIRGRLDPSSSFEGALGRMKRTLGDALEHQAISFGTLLENLSLPRDPSRVPLVPVSFNVDPGFRMDDFGGLVPHVRSVPRAFEIFEIFANLVDDGREILVETQYNADLFDGETLRDWLDSYEALLHGAVSTPTQPLERLSVLSEPARARILGSFNATTLGYDRDATLHGLFERQVAARSDHVALVFEGEQLTYRELDRRANQLAHRLQTAGVGPDQIVGVCVRRSLDMVVAQLGVLKAGGAYLPLDPSYPSERLGYMLSDAGAKLVVTRSDSVSVLGDAVCTRLLLDQERASLAAEAHTAPAVSVRGDNLAYVIYTSGSTGKPKGVLVEHQNFANFLAGMDQRVALAEPGVWLFATSIGFDISLLELFGSLARGFTVVIHSDESAPEHGLAQLATRHRVTHFQCTPSQAMVLLGDPAGREALSGLTELLLGGEALPLDLADKLTALLTRGRLLNMYGPTETTIWSTSHEVKAARGVVPIGRPIANTSVYVLDANGEPCARGVLGELYIGGDGVTRGYHQRPELTRERFVPDPFARAPDKRMYRTGDLAKFDKDGALVFFGRNDHQVKLRGYRIELGEIEVALRAHPAVREAVVIAREDRPGDKRLVAYVVCSPEPTVQALRAFLTEAGLPEYMLPQAFVALPRLPTTPNGKLDRRALPAPEGDSALSTGSYVAPRSGTERQLTEIWQTVLAMGRISVTSSFFDLGGHSLLAVRLASLVADAFGVPLPIARVFQAPTVEQLAAYVDAALMAADGERAPQDLDSDTVEIEL